VMRGAAIGLILALVVQFAVARRVFKLGLAAVSTAIAFGVAKYGQTQFAASFAEDAFAGQLWFFGWHATAAAASLTVALIILALMEKKSA